MKYTILEIMNAFSDFYLLKEVEISTLFENINSLKSVAKYQSILNEVNFDKKGISPELIGELATSIVNNDIIITKDKYLAFIMNQNLKEEISKNIENKNIYMSFMNDFINLTIEKEKINDKFRK